MLLSSSRLAVCAAIVLSGGALLLCSGCCESKAASAQSPPPQTLSEPVRPVALEPAQPPAIPVSVESREQRTGESRELPVFVEPSPPPKPFAAPVVTEPLSKPAAASAKPSGGRYHILAKGETLYGVSKKYNVKFQQILDANHFKDPNKLAVGTKVIIP